MYGFVYFMGFQTLGKSYLYLSFMTDDYNYYHAFTCSWVDGVGDYLLELLGPELMSQPLDVMTGCEDNVGMNTGSCGCPEHQDMTYYHRYDIDSEEPVSCMLG